MIKRITGLILAAAMLMSLLSCAVAEQGEKDSGKKEDTTNAAEGESSILPDFTVYTEDGKKVSLYDKLDRPVVINFWATWCPPCKTELPAFDALAKEYGDRVEFMMVNMTDGERETVDAVLEFLLDNGYSFPVYYDTHMDAAMTYGVSSIPLTVFMTSEGKMTDYHVGAMTEDVIRGYIEDLLNE